MQKDEELRSGRTLNTGAAPPSPRACAPDFIYDVNEYKFSSIIPEDSQVELRSLDAYAQLSLMLRQEEEKHLLEIKGAEEQVTKLPLLSQQVEAKTPLFEWERRIEDESSNLQLDDSKLALLLQQEEERRIQKLHQEKIIEEEADAKMALLLQQEESSRILTFVCDICMDSHSVDGSYELECEHRFCQSCLLGYFQSKTFDNQTENIKCPNCHVCISQEIVLGTMRDCKRQDMEEQFVERASWNLITKCSTFIHCPNESCNNYTEWDPRMQGLAYSCQLCKHDYCLRCQVNPHSKNTYSMGHKGRSCRQQRQQLEKDAVEKKKHDEWKVLNANAEIRLKQYIEKGGAKQCPNCKALIERNEGCDHMTCRNCKCNFCYICGQYNASAPTSRGDCGTTCKTKK